MKENINQTDSTSLFVSNLWPITSSCEGKEKDVLQEIIRCVIMKMEKLLFKRKGINIVNICTCLLFSVKWVNGMTASEDWTKQ